MIARNLLGRLNARTSDNLQRIASFWDIPLPDGDRGRQIGTLYRGMTDRRYARDLWGRLDERERDIVRGLATRDSIGSTVDEIAAFAHISPTDARESAIRLFFGGVLAREGDTQELPVGVSPRLFIPREVALALRRVQEEREVGDFSNEPLRTILDTFDDAQLEATATRWGLNTIPGHYRRGELIAQILRQVEIPERREAIIAAQDGVARTIWQMASQSASHGIPYESTMAAVAKRAANASGKDDSRAHIAAMSALGALEDTLLVIHTYRRDGSRWLFVPREIADPGQHSLAMRLPSAQPLAPDAVTPAPAAPPFAIAWDFLTLLRDISLHGATIGDPGEPVSRTWQRRVNRRLWFAGEEIPPVGYIGLLLHVGLAVGVIEPADSPLAAAGERRSLCLAATSAVRAWTRLSFDAQIAKLTEAWIASDAWLEGRERGEVEVWGADWSDVRRRALAASERLAPDTWYDIDDIARQLASQDPGLLGATFTAALARSAPPGVDERTASIAQVLVVEFETALRWFGRVRFGTTTSARYAVQIAQPAYFRASDGAFPVLLVAEDGTITLNAPTPLHVWSLSAFADAESLRPQATYRLRQTSVSRALDYGFDLHQIVTYLEQQSGRAVPKELLSHLSTWAVGYRRVRMQRVVLLTPDTPEYLTALREALTAAGIDVLAGTPGSTSLAVVTPSRSDGTPDEESLLMTLRASGFVGQWDAGSR